MNSLLSSSQLWALAAGDVLFHSNGFSYADEYALSKGEVDIDIIREEFLHESWSIVDEESAYSTLNWLAEVGHRSEFNRVRNLMSLMTPQRQEQYIESQQEEFRAINAKVVQRYDKVLPEAGILAWDLGRAAAVCYLSAEIGYISKEYAWSYLLDNAVQLQQSYSSWQEYGLAYIIGRQFWDKDLDDSSTMLHHRLIQRQLTVPECPWSFLPWNTKLNHDL